MFLTYEAPSTRPASPTQGTTPTVAYTRRFGAPPYWLDELPRARRNALLQHALRRGAPLTPADGV